jgi:hypothetical protein
LIVGKSSGAGASVSSGAGYQARVAAYYLATGMCGFEQRIPGLQDATHISFETRESIDDLSLRLSAGNLVYIQAKATIEFSLSGELRSVLAQFEAQEASGSLLGDWFVLATTSRASKKVTQDLRTALDIFRSSPEAEFFRDQPKAVSDIIKDLRSAISELQVEAGRPADQSLADRILRKSLVELLDVEDRAVLETAALVLIHANGFGASDAVWGKLIAECLEYGRTRRTVEIAPLKARFDRYKSANVTSDEQAGEDLLQVEFSKMDFSTSKDVLLCEIPEDSTILPPGPMIMEFKRFGDDCEERLNFSSENITLQNGISFKLLRRAATLSGLERYIEACPEVVAERELTIIPMNDAGELDEQPCAIIHRERLQQALNANPHRLRCVHCGAVVSEAAAEVVETGPSDAPIVGLVHLRCMAPGDRMLGFGRSEFSEENPHLVNFDVNGWAKASYAGQRTFANLGTIKSGPIANLAWGGPADRGPPKPFVIEVSLENGESEIVTLRNKLHRFTRAEAEAFSAQLNLSFAKAREEGDPICYTDESKGYGPRSILLQQFGLRERIRPVKTAQIRKYEVRLDREYTRPGYWYAPLIALRLLDTGEPFDLGGAAVLLTDPLSVGRFLENWDDAGWKPPPLETVALLSDNAFDQYMQQVDKEIGVAVVDPLFDPQTQKPLSATQIISTEKLIAHARGRGR